MVRRSPEKADYVRVVADNPETLDGLDAYFKSAGVASDGTRRLQDVSLVPPATTAVVLFPDDFRLSEVVMAIMALRHARPRLLIVVVTGAPQHLDVALAPDEDSVAPLVLPKPAFGWTVLDAIRGRADLALA